MKIFYPLHFPSEIKFRLQKISKQYPYSIAEKQFIKITIFKSPNQNKSFLSLTFPFILKIYNSIYRGQITLPWETPEPIFSWKRSFFPWAILAISSRELSWTTFHRSANTVIGSIIDWWTVEWRLIDGGWRFARVSVSFGRLVTCAWFQTRNTSINVLFFFFFFSWYSNTLNSSQRSYTPES